MTEFPVHPQLTTLIGPNGSGKTNILQAIVLLKKAFRPTGSRRGPKSTSGCTIAFEIVLGIETFDVVVDILYDSDDRNNDEVKECELKLRSSNSRTKKWNTIPINPFFFYKENKFAHLSDAHRLGLFPDFGPISESTLKAFEKILEYMDNSSYYSASQFSNPSECPVSFELDETRQPMRRHRGGASHELFMYDLYVASQSKSPAYASYISAINKQGIGLVDSIEFKTLSIPNSSFEVRAGGKIKQTERHRSMIVPLFTIDGNILSPNQLSEGTFKTLALTFYLLTDKSNLLLIEEPEVCVHHGLLSSIMSIVRSQAKRKQIIISTHSDFVLNHMQVESIVLVEKEGKKGTKARSLEASLSKQDFQALRSYLDETGNIGDYWRESGFTEL